MLPTILPHSRRLSAMWMSCIERGGLNEYVLDILLWVNDPPVALRNDR